jgi:hypothetical protein
MTTLKRLLLATALGIAAIVPAHAQSKLELVGDVRFLRPTPICRHIEDAAMPDRAMKMAWLTSQGGVTTSCDLIADTSRWWIVWNIPGLLIPKMPANMFALCISSQFIAGPPLGEPTSKLISCPGTWAVVYPQDINIEWTKKLGN